METTIPAIMGITAPGGTSLGLFDPPPIQVILLQAGKDEFFSILTSDWTYH
jgi:hypothetical protein